MDLEKKIEAILFYKSQPVSMEYLSSLLDVDLDSIKESVKKLKNNLEGRGIVLIQKDNEITLSTHPELSQLIEKIAHDEVSGPLTKAALETLAIIIYSGPITKAKIDYIRGVNSNFILRNLLVRGLIEKSPNPKDARTSLYKPSFDLISYLGVQSIEELPNYKNFKDKIETINNKTE